MKRVLLTAVLLFARAATSVADSAAAPAAQVRVTPREGHISVARADLFFREIGRGEPIIVLHGGPDFDHSYLLPDMDRLSDSYRLIYYDQRGRGRSADGVKPEDVTLESEIGDLDAVRQHFKLHSATILGHSWGAVLALEYAIRHPDRVSRLILMNPAPASKDDFMLLRKDRLEKRADALEKMKAIAATAAYEEGDPDAVAAYYRIHFSAALERPEHLDRLMATMRASFTKEGILKARAVEDRLMDDTWLAKERDYDLLPKLRSLNIPALVIYGDHEFIPEECAAHIARAIPDARYVTLKQCGHFSYLECPDAVRKDIDDFFKGSNAPARPH
jgi:proline iminopeptidase